MRDRNENRIRQLQSHLNIIAKMSEERRFELQELHNKYNEHNKEPVCSCGLYQPQHEIIGT